MICYNNYKKYFNFFLTSRWHSTTEHIQNRHQHRNRRNRHIQPGSGRSQAMLQLPVQIPTAFQGDRGSALFCWDQQSAANDCQRISLHHRQSVQYLCPPDMRQSQVRCVQTASAHLRLSAADSRYNYLASSGRHFRRHWIREDHTSPAVFVGGTRSTGPGVSYHMYAATTLGCCIDC